MSNRPSQAWLTNKSINYDESLPAHQRTYDILRQAIMIGRIPFGEPLTIRGVAEKLQVSPTPVREAIRRLSSEGAIEVLDTRRIKIPEMDRHRFEALIDFRKHLECYAAESALKFISDYDIDEIEQIDYSMDEKILNNEAEQTVIYNQLFHKRIYKANPNQVILNSIESVWLQLGPYSRIIFTNLSEMYPEDHHKSIITALKNRDIESLKKSISKDIEDGIAKSGRKLFERQLS